MIRSVPFLEARDAMREGALLIRQKSPQGERYFVEPGGKVSLRTFTTLRLIPNVTAAHDGGIGGSQTWTWSR